MESIIPPTLPKGFRVVVDTGDCPADLGQMSLRDSPELAALVSEIAPIQRMACASLVTALQSDAPLETAGTGSDLSSLPPQAGLILGTVLASAVADWRLALAAVIGALVGLPPLYKRAGRKRRFAKGELEKAEAVEIFRKRLEAMESLEAPKST